MGVNPTLLFTVINIDIGSFEVAELKIADKVEQNADQSKRASDDAKDQM